MATPTGSGGERTVPHPTGAARIDRARRVVYAAAAVASLGAVLWSGSLEAFLAAHAHDSRASTYLASVVMWQAMMVAMMTPTVAPWIAAYARIAGGEPAIRGAAPAAWFAGGYFAIWLAYSAGAAAVQVALAATGLIGHERPVWWLPPLVLAGAGIFQFTPLKAACLAHCRNPISFLLTSWRGGPPDPFAIGVRHGAYCVGCCWVLMLTGFAMGLMNVAWMAVLTVAIAVEQRAPFGPQATKAIGVSLIGWALWLAGNG